MIEYIPLIKESIAPVYTQGIQQPWGWGTIVYYWLASMATFTFVVAFIYMLAREENWAVRWGLRLAGPIAIVALLAELVELGNPGVMHYVFSKIFTPIAIDAISAAVFIVTSLIYAFAVTLPRSARNIIGWIAVLAAIVWLIGRVGQFTLSASARPFWGESMPAILLLSSLILGVATLKLIWTLGSLTGRAGLQSGITVLNSIAAFSVPSLALLIAFHMARALSGEETLVKSATIILYGASSQFFWAGVILGLIIPGIIYAVLYVFKGVMSEKAQYAALAISSAFIIIGILALYAALFSAGLRVPLPGEAMIA